MCIEYRWEWSMWQWRLLRQYNYNRFDLYNKHNNFLFKTGSLSLNEVTRRMGHVVQELLTLPEDPSSLVFNVVFCRSLFLLCCHCIVCPSQTYDSNFHKNVSRCLVSNRKKWCLTKPTLWEKNNHVSHKNTVHKIKGIPTYDVVNPDPGLGQAHKYVGVRLVNGIPNFPCW